MGELPGPEPQLKPHEIELGVGFRPFEHETGQIPPNPKKPFMIEERYPHSLALRRGVKLFNLKGAIDLITENRDAPAQALRERIPMEQPLGRQVFRFNNGELIEAPLVLRFSFLVKTPAEYVKLIESCVDIKIGNEMYFMIFAPDQQFGKEYFDKLENGIPLRITTKGLVNLEKEKERLKKASPEEREELDKAFEEGRLFRRSFVWLPARLDPLKTIECTFRSIDDGFDDDEEQDPVPPNPVKELQLV